MREPSPSMKPTWGCREGGLGGWGSRCASQGESHHPGDPIDGASPSSMLQKEGNARTAGWEGRGTQCSPSSAHLPPVSPRSPPLWRRSAPVPCPPCSLPPPSPSSASPWPAPGTGSVRGREQQHPHPTSTLDENPPNPSIHEREQQGCSPAYCTPCDPLPSPTSCDTYRSEASRHGHGGHLAGCGVLRALGGGGFAHHAADAPVRTGALRAEGTLGAASVPAPSPVCPPPRWDPREQGVTKGGDGGVLL